MGKFYKPFEKTDWMPGTLISSFAIVVGWGYFIWTGTIQTIWPMYGIANQLLASAALAVGTIVIVKEGKAKYAWVTIVPMVFVAVTTATAGIHSIFHNFLPLAQTKPFQGYLNAALTALMITAVIILLIESARAWIKYAKEKKQPERQ